MVTFMSFSARWTEQNRIENRNCLGDTVATGSTSGVKVYSRIPSADRKICLPPRKLGWYLSLLLPLLGLLQQSAGKDSVLDFGSQAGTPGFAAP
mmetsp:Transcript_15932/g.32930  ORF Transcript_15932/g.32930 Transcript_15932/m.32930 type:complete len:94 (+) Transcript_15932:932-1213(+)